MDVTTIAGAILMAATMTAGAMRWAAQVLKSAMHEQTAALRDTGALVKDNTSALREQTAALREQTAALRKVAAAAVLCLLLLAGCGSVQREYVLADEAKYNAVWPDYSRYFEADPALSQDSKQGKRDVGTTWRARIDAAKRSLEE